MEMHMNISFGWVGPPGYGLSSDARNQRSPTEKLENRDENGMARRYAAPRNGMTGMQLT